MKKYFLLLFLYSAFLFGLDNEFYSHLSKENAITNFDKLPWLVQFNLGNEEKFSIDLAREKFKDFALSFPKAHEVWLAKDKHVTKQLIRDYVFLADRILSEYDKNDFIFVALGASPLFLMEIFAVLGVECADIPLSLKEQSLTKYSDQKFLEFFDHFLQKLFTSEKNILLIDFVFTGGSILRAKELIEVYLTKRQLPHEVITLGLRQSLECLKPKYFGQFIQVTPTLSEHLLEGFAKHYRKYPRISAENFSSISLPLSSRCEHNFLRNFFLELAAAPRAKL